MGTARVLASVVWDEWPDRRVRCADRLIRFVYSSGPHSGPYEGKTLTPALSQGERGSENSTTWRRLLSPFAFGALLAHDDLAELGQIEIDRLAHFELESID